jgi:hypothetical protein
MRMGLAVLRSQKVGVLLLLNPVALLRLTLRLTPLLRHLVMRGA